MNNGRGTSVPRLSPHTRKYKQERSKMATQSTLILGEDISQFSSASGKLRTWRKVNEDDLIRVAMLRSIAILCATRREPVRYLTAADIVGVYHYGPAISRPLDMLSVDCLRRGEPSLAVMFVNRRGRSGIGFDGNAERERKAVYKHW